MGRARLGPAGSNANPKHHPYCQGWKHAKGKMFVFSCFFHSVLAENCNTDAGLRATGCCLQDAAASGNRADGAGSSPGPPLLFMTFETSLALSKSSLRFCCASAKTADFCSERVSVCTAAKCFVFPILVLVFCCHIADLNLFTEKMCTFNLFRTCIISSQAHICACGTIVTILSVVNIVMSQR